MTATLAAKFEEANYPFGQYKSSYPDYDVVAELVPADEEPLVVARGPLVGKGRGNTIMQGTDFGSFATLVLTNKSLHMFGKSNALTSKVKRSEVYTFQTITGVSRQKKALQGWTIEVSRASNVDYFANLVEKDSELLYNKLRDLVAEAQKGGGGTTIINQIDPMDQLKKLKDLLDAGILSQEEFEEKKKALLDKI